HAQGPTETGEAPFLAQTNVAPFLGVSYIPVQPLETQVPIAGNPKDGNIFQQMGQLSHYFPNPDGFGVYEYPLPQGANITGLNMLHRHGARYPTTGSGAVTLGAKITNATGHYNATGDLAFLKDWKYVLGAEILVPVGKQELFDSGTLHYYQYGHLYPNNGSKIIARSTTQDRMTQSAEYFLAGFFGLGWTQNATLELIIEQNGFNNSLAGYYRCNNSNSYQSKSLLTSLATTEWAAIYLENATNRIAKQVPGLDWNLTDTYNAQSLCAYETVALGFSPWCGLFTYEEWLDYEYSVDIQFAGNYAFQSPAGRAVGIGYVEEVLARMNHHLISSPTASVNVTLDNMTSTFPLNQSLYFDFTHDTNIMSILTAFGLTQFAPFMPATSYQANRSLIVSHMEPFASRFDIEYITAPHPVLPSRSPTKANPSGAQYNTAGEPTMYVHFLLNQRTIPLGRSLEACGQRDDGWCEMNAFLEVQKGMLQEAEYNWSCNGDYPAVPYGTVTNGVPVQPPPPGYPEARRV
ncbi:phosphoglycerate mutase-like protein, partial [Saccharata proteae CBS 121410]